MGRATGWAPPGPPSVLMKKNFTAQRSPVHDRPSLERSRQQPSGAIHPGGIHRKQNDGWGGIERAALSARVTHDRELPPALPLATAEQPLAAVLCRATVAPPAPRLLPPRLLLPCWLLLPPRLLLACSQCSWLISLLLPES
jgi:hypothetical protein